MDPSLQIDVLTELELGESTAGVRQVPGLHNGTKAFLFQGMALCEAPCAVGRGRVGVAGPAAPANLALHPGWAEGPSWGEGFMCAQSRALLNYFFSRFPRPPPPPHLVYLAVLIDSALITD